MTAETVVDPLSDLHDALSDLGPDERMVVLTVWQNLRDTHAGGDRIARAMAAAAAFLSGVTADSGSAFAAELRGIEKASRHVRPLA